MYLEIYESVGKTGEVRFNPYSSAYHGPSELIRDYLEDEPRFEEPASVPGEMAGSPSYQAVTNELGKLRLTSHRLRNRGAWQCEIVDE